MLDHISVNYQSSIRIKGSKVLYFDPVEIKENRHDADYIFITHNHYDHFSPEAIEAVKKASTKLIAPASMDLDLEVLEFDPKNIILMQPHEVKRFNDIQFLTTPAHNLNKTFHPRENNWLGYEVILDKTRYYISGDIDNISHLLKIRPNIVFVPIGGHYTMNALEAADFVKALGPDYAIPTHYGFIVGQVEDGQVFKEALENTKTQVVLKAHQ
ncbi:TPA: MBL fold metallo-hydrolase [Streptococcus suis]